MQDKVCSICKYHGKLTWGKHKDAIYHTDKLTYVHLCYNHSIDLFKMGQTKFMAKHNEVFVSYSLVNEDFSNLKIGSMLR